MPGEVFVELARIRNIELNLKGKFPRELFDLFVDLFLGV
jgi:hypothetical protein